MNSSRACLKCERRDSNPHGFPHWILSPARLPIPPLSQHAAPTPEICSAAAGDAPSQWPEQRIPLWVTSGASQASLGKSGVLAASAMILHSVARTGSDSGVE